jgi:urease accessory protein UreH
MQQRSAGAAAKHGALPARAQDADELPGAEWVYMLGHGGGIVSGDVTRVKVRVGAGCTAVMTTQSFTKVFTHHNDQMARQVSFE